MSDDSTATVDSLRGGLGADPLWNFALTYYSRPGVEDACLLLQDEAGVDVCELLWRCWLYRHRLRLPHEPLGLTQIQRWQQGVTVPLRALRRQLKADARSSSSIAEVRRHIQQAELAAERETLTRLQRLALESEQLSPLTSKSPGLGSYLSSCWKLQKKAQLLAVQTLECQLDPL